jgi:hypothetical protein
LSPTEPIVPPQEPAPPTPPAADPFAPVMPSGAAAPTPTVTAASEPLPPPPPPLVVPPGPYHAPESKNTLGLIGLILAIVLPPVGLITSVVARRRSDTKLGLAGVIVGSVETVVLVGLFGFTAFTTLQQLSQSAKVSDQFVADVRTTNGTDGYALESPDIQAQATADQLQSLFQSYQIKTTPKEASRSLQSINGVQTATTVYNNTGGQPAYIKVSTQRLGNKWLIVGLSGATTAAGAK